MITKFGMSEKLGLINYDNDSDEVFIGRDFGHASSRGSQLLLEKEKLTRSEFEALFEK
ncbi:Uncharacterised protein [Dorea longicatena]|nr:Uncharacterised protein [Dorea longicatena]